VKANLAREDNAMGRKRIHADDAARRRAYRERRRRGPLEADDWEILAVLVAHLAVRYPKEQGNLEFLAARLQKLAQFFGRDLLTR